MIPHLGIARITYKGITQRHRTKVTWEGNKQLLYRRDIGEESRIKWIKRKARIDQTLRNLSYQTTPALYRTATPPLLRHSGPLHACTKFK